MSGAVPMRDDYSGDELRRFARAASDGEQTRRLMALAAICDGKNRMEVAAIGLMDRQTLRDWVIRWRCIDLVKVARKHFGVECHEMTISRILHELGFSHISPRPQHPKQDQQAIEEYKKLR